MTLDDVRQMMVASGCRRLYLKVLAANDNSKNQVYLGGNFSAINILPFRDVRAERGGNLAKSGRTSNPIFKAALSFSWLDDRGQACPAPHAQLILYPQYPEVRLSGFLLGCRSAPSSLMKMRQTGRVLLLGITASGEILARVSAHDSPIAKELADLIGTPDRAVLHQLPVEPTALPVDTRVAMLKALGLVHRKGWIDGKRLKRGVLVPYNATNAGGYTLEAELGINPNGYAEPDYLGWEVKQHGVKRFGANETGRLTLLTPEPTMGVYRDQGVIAFVRKYGQPDKACTPGKLYFCGIHKAGEYCKRTGLTLMLFGYDSVSGITDESGGICLVSDSDEIAAKWPFAQFILHWNRKHANAVYVPARSRQDGATRQYRFGDTVRMGEGTDFLLFLKAMSEGLVYYDPGVKVEGLDTNKPRPKKRSQFRVHSRDLPRLYHTMSHQSVLS